MNVKEGTRRLALLVGVIGAIAGGVASYAILSDAIEAHARYKAFERQATSGAVEQERKYLLSLHLSPDTVPVYTNFEGPPPGTIATPISGAQQADPYAGIGASVGVATKLPPLPPGAVLVPFGSPAPGQSDKGIDLSSGFVPFVPGSIASAGGKEGIKSVVWNKNLEVQSIEKEDGDVVISELKPSFWTYLLVMLLPVVGFVILWGAIRALGWVGYGFAEIAK